MFCFTCNHGLTRNSHSRSFVMYFEITGKPTRDSILLYKNAGLILKVSEETESETSESWSCGQPHSRPTPLPRKSTNIRINLTLRESRVIELHFAVTVWVYLWQYGSICDSMGLSVTVWVYLWQYGSIFIQIFLVGSERRMLCAKSV